MYVYTLSSVKFGEKEYFAYLDVKAGNQDKAWAPHRVY